MSDSPLRSPPSCWVLSAPGAGDRRQLHSLADALGGRNREIAEIDSVATVLADRLKGAAHRAFTRSKAKRYAPPWPDLVLIAGGRSVVDARRIRAASDGVSRIVAIGRPWAAYEPLDLIVTTPQYRLPPADNLIEIPLPLNAPPLPSDAARKRLEQAAPSKEGPRVGVLLGGDSGSYRFGPRAIEETAISLAEFARSSGARLVVCDSPRTPSGALEALERRLGARGVFFSSEAASMNPYPAVVADCDALAVTGDSASMLAEACLAGKPVAVLPLSPRRRSRAARGVGAWMPSSVRDALTCRGLWLPARDLTRLHAEAESRGWVRPLDQLLDGPVPNPPSMDSLLSPVRQRIDALLLN